MEHEDEGQASTALTRFAVTLAKCLVAGFVAGALITIMMAIVEVPQ